MANRMPKKLMNAYYKMLRKQIVQMERLTRKTYQENIIPIMLRTRDEINRQTVMRTNANILDGIAASIRYLLDRAEAEIDAELARLNEQVQEIFSYRTARTIATQFVEQVNVVDKTTTTQQVRSVLGSNRLSRLIGFDLLEDRGTEKIVTESIDRNVRYIVGLPEEYMEKVGETIKTGLVNGDATTTIGKEISKASGVTERRGQFIARNELGTVYGELTAQRQENLGIKRFRWLTSEDERVRPSHKKLNNHVYEWEKGAQGPEVEDEVWGLLPGEDDNCRCTSEVVEEDIFEMYERLARERGE